MADKVRGPGLSFGLVDIHPCEGCEHREKCSTGYACSLLRGFIKTGYFSGIAERKPSRAIYERLFA
jgi:hypothetical protein